MVCAARYHGLLRYKHSDSVVVTGCTKKPGEKSQVLKGWVLTLFSREFWL